MKLYAFYFWWLVLISFMYFSRIPILTEVVILLIVANIVIKVL